MSKNEIRLRHPTASTKPPKRTKRIVGGSGHTKSNVAQKNIRPRPPLIYIPLAGTMPANDSSASERTLTGTAPLPHVTWFSSLAEGMSGSSQNKRASIPVIHQTIKNNDTTGENSDDKQGERIAQYVPLSINKVMVLLLPQAQLCAHGVRSNSNRRKSKE